MTRSTARNESSGPLSKLAKRALEETVPANNSSGYIDFRSLLHTTQWGAPTRPADETTPLPSVRDLRISRSDAPVSLDSPSLSGAVSATDPITEDDTAPDTERDPESTRRFAYKRSPRAWLDMLPGLSAGGLVGALTALLVSMWSAPPEGAPSSAAAQNSMSAQNLISPTENVSSPVTLSNVTRDTPSNPVAPVALTENTLHQAPPPTSAPRVPVRAPSHAEEPTATSMEKPTNSKGAWKGVIASKKASSATQAPSATPRGEDTRAPAPAAHETKVDPCNGDLMCAMKRAVGEH